MQNVGANILVSFPKAKRPERHNLPTGCVAIPFISSKISLISATILQYHQQKYNLMQTVHLTPADLKLYF